MRDLVLAEQFQDVNIFFATRNLPGNINHKIEEKGYALIRLGSNSIEELDKHIKKLSIDMIVIDHYGIDHIFENQLKIQNPTLKIMVLDDTYEKHHCDILLNHNIYAETRRYKDLVPEHCELRCGKKFMLIRDEFYAAKKEKETISLDPKGKTHVFVAMGGADTLNLNIPILKTLKEHNEIHAHVVTTRANKNLEELQCYAKNHDHVTLYIETDKIAKLISKADFAIITPSVTINEIFFMELPFIAIKTADNQKEMCSYLKERGQVLLEKFDEKKFENELSAMVDFLQTGLINFTQLTKKQKLDILEWRNNPSIRRWMLDKEPIEPKDHLSFIDSLKNRSDRLYFLVKTREEPIGVIDFTQIDKNKKCAHIGLYTKPSTHGKGKLLMQKIMEFGYDNLGLETLIAEVYDTNDKAINLYKRFGFKPTENGKSGSQRILRMERKK